MNNKNGCNTIQDWPRQRGTPNLSTNMIGKSWHSPFMINFYWYFTNQKMKFDMKEKGNSCTNMTN